MVAERVGLLYFMLCVARALACDENLRKIFRLLVCYRPLVISDVESRWLCFTAFSFRLLLALLRFRGLFCFLLQTARVNILDILLDSSLLGILEADDSLDLAQVFLNGKELIHEPDLELILILGHLARLAEALKQYQLLILSLLLNGSAHELQHKLLVE